MTQTAPPQRSPRLVTKAWVQGVALVMLFGFFIMGLLAYSAYKDGMPQPRQVVGPQNEVVVTGEDITSGQQIFLRRGLQEQKLGYVLAVTRAQRLGFSRVEDRVAGLPATSWHRLSAGATLSS